MTNKQFATGLTWAAVARTSLLEVRFGYSYTVAGKNPPALGSDERARTLYGIPGLPSDPRVAGGLPNQTITGYSDLGRQATNPQWQYPRVFNPKVNYSWVQARHSFKSGYEFQHVQTEVQDVNPLYGRDTYGSQVSRPTGVAAATTSTTSPISCWASGRSTRSATSWSRTCGRTCTSSTCRTTGGSTTS